MKFVRIMSGKEESKHKRPNEKSHSQKDGLDLPKRYDPKESEKKWQKYWEDHDIYKFDTNNKGEVYAIDTPPPTVSGRIHLGHSFSYAQQDFIARFKRMKQCNVFYPFGTDDNGIASERLVEKKNNVRATSMDRKAFVKLCLETIKPIRETYINDMKQLGMSCDFSVFYSTINKHCQKISQRSFIDLYNAGREYRKEAPFMWCPQCQTAISQVECEDDEIPSHFNDIIFKVEGEEDLIISTTRPEFLPATVGVFFHPDDKRYERYLKKKAKVPLFDLEVPIMTDETCDPDKGTGIMMVCTFGDQEDVEKWFRYKLPLRDLVRKDGTLSDLAGKYAGHSVTVARKLIIEDLKDARLLISQTPINHSVRTHERCGTPIEFILTKQWFIRYLDLKDQMLEWGSKLNWYPAHMKVRYDNWVKGLQWDWCISRQRFSGIPFPVWYCRDCDEIVLAQEKDLPVDPLTQDPPIKKCRRCGCAEFIPEKDIMDTWATSSLTPQLAVELFDDISVRKRLYPMSLRPQAHDIITFWLFNTVVKSQLHNNVNPWKDVVISGHAQDPHGKKMSKSKGNVIEPLDMIEKYSSDALRFWAASSKLGDDLPFQEKELVSGTKFITKLWNASKFGIMHLAGKEIQRPKDFNMIDRWLLSKLHTIIKASTETFERYEYSRTKQEIENFFWNTFCDNYLELVKDRLYNPESYDKEEVHSARYTLYQAILSILKMMAPIMPFITEEIFNLYFARKENKKSIHNSAWPKHEQELIDDKAEGVGFFVIQAIASVRKAKSDANLSLKAPVERIEMMGRISEQDFGSVKKDIVAITKAKEVSYKQLPSDSEIDYEDRVDL
jgi:valyl-tRNA synthetase